MSHKKTEKHIRRRAVIMKGLTLGSLALTPRVAQAAVLATPAQTEGPFYPRHPPLDSDSDLVTTGGRPESAAGTVLHLFGAVLDQEGRPLPDATVEIWQCDAFGRYHHPRDGGGADPNFQGYGRMAVDPSGRYRFRTIRPVPYATRTPHIHFAVSGPGWQRFVTQMYVADEPRNARDGILQAVRDPVARARLLVALRAAPEIEAGSLTGQFDIVLDDRLLGG